MSDRPPLDELGLETYTKPRRQRHLCATRLCLADLRARRRALPAFSLAVRLLAGGGHGCTDESAQATQHAHTAAAASPAVMLRQAASRLSKSVTRGVQVNSPHSHALSFIQAPRRANRVC